MHRDKAEREGVPEDTEKTGWKIPRNLMIRLRVFVARHPGLTQTEVIVDALVDWLNEEEEGE